MHCESIYQRLKMKFGGLKNSPNKERKKPSDEWANNPKSLDPLKKNQLKKNYQMRKKKWAKNRPPVYACKRCDFCNEMIFIDDFEDHIQICGGGGSGD